MKKAVLAYSGGLDTSVAIKWLQDNHGCDVIALVADVGQNEDLEAIRHKALKTGAADCHVVDARDDLARNYLLSALRANALYEGKYPLASALSRPLIARLLVQTAHQEGAEAVAHGCTGKGNDQVRFDVSVSALDPDLTVLAPVRDWPMSRDEQIAYAARHGIDVPVREDNPFSIDENLWGRSIECGVLENPWTEPPEEAFKWTVSPVQAPDDPEDIEITFKKGAPTALDGTTMEPSRLIARLNVVAGRHGVGRIDHVENRLVGIKSREVYEAPAASVLISAHRDLEQLTLPRQLAHYKQMLEQKYAELAYNGLWYSPLRGALDAFMIETQQVVSGTVRVRLYRGMCTVTGRKSEHSLYDTSLATYGQGDMFSHDSAEGFIEVWGLPSVVYSRVNGGSKREGRAAN